MELEDKEYFLDNELNLTGWKNEDEGENIIHYICDEEEIQARFYRKEQQVMNYAMEFWDKLLWRFDSEHKKLSDKILPIHCTHKIVQLYKANVNGTLDYIEGGCLKVYGKQASINIDIDVDDDILDDTLKSTIRHELIHYPLYMLGYKYSDNSLPFWLLCYVFNGNAYAPLSKKDSEKYKLFVRLYKVYKESRDENVHEEGYFIRYMIKQFKSKLDLCEVETEALKHIEEIQWYTQLDLNPALAKFI